MNNDDITRLADKWESEAVRTIDGSDIARPRNGQIIADTLLRCSRELRTLAQQGKAGGVQIVGWCHEDELPNNYPYDAMFPHSKVNGVRLFPVYAPANPHEAGVADEMAWDALCSQAPHEAGHSHEHDEEAMLIDIMGLGRPEHHERALRIMKHALSLALAPQPKDAT